MESPVNYLKNECRVPTTVKNSIKPQHYIYLMKF